MSNASADTAATASVERDDADEVISMSSIKTLSREMKQQLYQVFDTHKKVCRAYNHLLQEQEQAEEIIADSMNTDEDKPKQKRALRKATNPSPRDSSAHTNDDLATQLADLKKKMAKQELQIQELTSTVNHLRSDIPIKKPNGYVERTVRVVEVALPSSSKTNGTGLSKRKREQSVRSDSYHAKRSRSPSRSPTPSPTKLDVAVKSSPRKRGPGRPSKTQVLPSLAQSSSSRSPEKRSSFLAAMSTKMLATDESESDESYELPKDAVNGGMSEDEKGDSESDSASIVSATMMSSSKRERARSGSSELGLPAPRTSSSVTAASQNGSTKGSRSNGTRRSTRVPSS